MWVYHIQVIIIALYDSSAQRTETVERLIDYDTHLFQEENPVRMERAYGSENIQNSKT